MKQHFFNSKAYAVCFALFCLCNVSNGQKNLVPNYSFENYTICPNVSVSNAVPWFLNCKKGFLDGYLNACANTSLNQMGVPNNLIKGLWNYQPAHTGQAYVFADYINGIYDRQYIETKLLDSLKSGKRYYVEFYVNLPSVMDWACNNSGALLTKNPFFGDTINFLCGFYFGGASVLGYGNPVILDTAGWTKIAGIYTAQGGEKYITLGNFYSKSNTNIVLLKNIGGNECSYFIDDVSVYNLDSFNLKADAGKDTTIALGDSAFIGSYTNGIDSLKWQLQTTGVKIDSTRPGFWVKPTASTCYVLTQTVNGFTSSDTVCINVGVVPLKFTMYDVRFTIEKTIENFWTTNNEINVSHFNIQRSINGSDFINVGKVVANNKNYNEYHFTDDKLPLLTTDQLTIYYRLQSVDRDGRKQYTEIKTINYKPQTINGFSLHPNPTKDFINISSKESIKEIRIINQLGQVVKQLKVKSEKLRVDVSDLPKGLYVLNITTIKGEVKNEKLIIE